MRTQYGDWVEVVTSIDGQPQLIGEQLEDTLNEARHHMHIYTNECVKEVQSQGWTVEKIEHIEKDIPRTSDDGLPFTTHTVGVKITVFKEDGVRRELNEVERKKGIQYRRSFNSLIEPGVRRTAQGVLNGVGGDDTSEGHPEAQVVRRAGQ